MANHSPTGMILQGGSWFPTENPAKPLAFLP